MEGQYATLTVTACEGGWLVKEAGEPQKVFVRWEAVVSLLKARLTS